MRSALTAGGIGLAFVLRGAALCVGLGAATSAQIGVTGGLQSVTWTKDCATAESFVNGTGIPLAGFWIGIGNDGVTNSPEIRDIVVTVGVNVWDVDDNEDRDNNDGSEGDTTDSTPTTGLPLGWHRVQASASTEFVGVNGAFTLTLCNSSGMTLTGEIFFVPMGPSALGASDGDLSIRTEAPFSVTQALPSAQVVIEGVNAPPFSETFLALCTNADTARLLSKIRIDPPGSADIVVATATKGGVYSDGPPATILWPTPIATGSSTRITTTISAFARALSSTVGFVATEFTGGIQVPGAPALPAWGFVVLVAALLLAGYLVLQRRS